MNIRSKTAEQASCIEFRSTSVWKQIRTTSLFRVLWGICDFSMLIVASSLALPENDGWLIPAVWTGSALFGRLMHRLRRPLPANEHLLAGVLGVLASGVFSLGHKLLHLVISTVLLGISAALTASGSFHDHLQALWNGFECNEEEQESCKRELVHDTMLPALILAFLVMFVLHMRLTLTMNLLMMCASLCLIFAAVNDPVDRRVLNKLKLLARLQQEGRDTAELKKWLSSRLVEKYRRSMFVMILYNVIHRFYRHRVIGYEQVQNDELNPVIYMCNHGNIYGPVAAYVFTPEHVRPWTISNMMIDFDETVSYLYKYTFSEKKWMPRRMRHAAAVLASKAAHHVFRAIESIPVYRDYPMELMKTFRGAIGAMQCGDNMLIFPENPNAQAAEHGYERDGVGQLFSGFAITAQMWYRKTGLSCRFVPMYADKKHRILRFGQPVVYDPDNAAAAERERIVNEISCEMNRLASVSDCEVA